MHKYNKTTRISALFLSLTFIIILFPAKTHAEEENTEKQKYIKYVEFNPTLPVLEQALEYDISSYGSETHLNWIELLAYAAARGGGEFETKRSAVIDKLVERLRGGEKMEDITADMQYYNYYFKAYNAILKNFVGEHSIEVYDAGSPDEKKIVTRYSLKCFSPIARGYNFSHYRDFGNARNYGYRRVHFGNDLMGSVGTPIIAVEGGIVEALGWNQYGGWRVGIRSFDGQRYYYYAHLRKNHPFHYSLDEGSIVNAGDVIGYLGMTGYSSREGVNNINTPHLHFGLQLIFDESQKEGTNQIWVDVYSLVELLQKNRSAVFYDEASKDYNRVYHFADRSDSAAGKDFENDPEYTLPVIMYHSILPDLKYAGDYVLPPDILENDLKYLFDRGYESVTITDLINFVDFGTPLPEKPVMLTFDDGFYNNLVYVPPLLEKYGMRAVLSPVGSFSDEYTKNGIRSEYYSMVTWEDLQTMESSGLFELQNHSYDLHSQKPRHGVARCAGESDTDYRILLTSDFNQMQDALEKITGVRPLAFTYPFGHYNETSESVLRELGFRASLSCVEKNNNVSRDPNCLWLLGRYNRPYKISTENFMAKLSIY